MIIILKPNASGCLKGYEFQCFSFQTCIISKTLLKVKCTNKTGILLIFPKASSFLIYCERAYRTQGLIIFNSAAMLSRGSWQITQREEE